MGFWHRGFLLGGALALLAGGGWWLYELEGLKQIRGREYRIGADHSPPYYFHRADGGVEGLAVDVMNAAAKRAGIRLRWVAEKSSPDASLDSGRAEIWPALASVKERERKFYISKPWLENNFVSVSLRSSRPVIENEPLRSVGVRDGAFTLRLAQRNFPKAKVTSFRLREDVLGALCRGEVQRALFEARFLDSALLERPLECASKPLSVRVIPGAKSELRIMSRREVAGAAALLREAVSALAEDGGLGRALETWSAFSSVDARAVYDLQESERRSTFYVYCCGVAVAGLGVLLWMFRRAQRAESLMKIALRKAERASLAKTDFLANVSHEIRTPLNGVIGMTRLVLDNPIGEAQRPELDCVLYSAESLRNVLNDVLDLSKIEAGQFQIFEEAFDLHELTERTVELFRQPAAVKELRLTYLYPPAAPRHFVGDAARLRQILMNYVGNAMKFTERGTIALEVFVSTNEGWQKRVRIEVKDSGIGIAKDVQPKLFEKFVQADASTTRKYGGTGLGLAISRHLAELMGGSVGLESVEGEGSLFWIELPLALAGERALEGRHANAAAPLLQLRGKVLVAEDNPINQRLIEKALSRSGLEVRIVGDGMKALEAFSSTPYDLIFMDCQMPLMDGYDSTKEIRRREKGGNRTPIVAITANAFAEDEARCRAMGMDEYLRKPIDLRELNRILERYLERAEEHAPV